jgi:hypothetical protein
MKVTDTSTTTSTTSAQIPEQTENKKDAQSSTAQGKPPKENAVTDPKASQALAEQSKATQNLNAEIQRNQLQQLLPSAPTKTATVTKGGQEKTEITNLDQLSKAHGLDQKQIADVKSFAKQHGVPENDLIIVGNNTRYSGAEKVEAMKAYAITYDAVNSGKVSAEKASEIKNHVLPNLLEGKIGVRLKDMSGAHAQYNSRNDGNKAGYEPNTMYFPKEGLNLESRQDRATVVHESYHAFQDATKQKMTFMESEKSGHSIEAEYLLRDSGALKDTPNGRQLDHDKFEKILRDPDYKDLQPEKKSEKANEGPTKKCMVEQFAQAADSNWKNNQGSLNGNLSGEGRNAGSVIRGMYPEVEGSFDDVYLRSKNDPLSTLFTNQKKSDEKVKEELNQLVPHDGI